MFLFGGKSNIAADVNKDHQLQTNSATRSLDNFINGESGKVWSLSMEDIDPAGADDKFFYLENTGTQVLKITDFRFSSTVAGIIKVKKVSGTPTYIGETAVTPVSRRTDKAPILSATANTDTDITGLSDEGIWFFLPLDSAGKLTHIRTSANVMIAPGGKIALEWDTGTGVLTGTVSLSENGID